MARRVLPNAGMSSLRRTVPWLVLSLLPWLSACGGDTGVSGTHLPELADGGGAGGSAASGGAGGFVVSSGGAGGFVLSSGGAGGSAASGGAGGSAGSSGGVGGTCPKGAPSPTDGRPMSPVCPPTSLSRLGYPDAGVPCKVNADCGSSSPFGVCLHGVCGVDACTTDDDCGAGSACVCGSSFYGGNGFHGNVCVTAQCRIDADCGPAGTCAPSFSGYCGAPSGYFCHSSADACRGDADCCLDQPACRYQPTLGRWACQSVTVCSG